MNILSLNRGLRLENIHKHRVATALPGATCCVCVCAVEHVYVVCSCTAEGLQAAGFIRCVDAFCCLRGQKDVGGLVSNMLQIFGSDSRCVTGVELQLLLGQKNSEWLHMEANFCH